jgi:hypothetical protein
MQMRAISTVQYFQPEVPTPPVKLLVMSSTIDEALGSLTGAWWVHRFNQLLLRLITAASILVSMGGAALIADLIMSFLERANVGQLSTELAVAASALCGLASLFIVLAIVKSVGVVSSRLALWMGLGLDDTGASLLTRVRASRRPLNLEHDHRQYEFFHLRRQADGLPTHSLLYNHIGAIRDIADWISTKSTTAATKADPSSAIVDAAILGDRRN